MKHRTGYASTALSKHKGREDHYRHTLDPDPDERARRLYLLEAHYYHLGARDEPPRPMMPVDRNVSVVGKIYDAETSELLAHSMDEFTQMTGKSDQVIRSARRQGKRVNGHLLHFEKGCRKTDPEPPE